MMTTINLDLSLCTAEDITALEKSLITPSHVLSEDEKTINLDLSLYTAEDITALEKSLITPSLVLSEDEKRKFMPHESISMTEEEKSRMYQKIKVMVYCSRGGLVNHPLGGKTGKVANTPDHGNLISTPFGMNNLENLALNVNTRVGILVVDLDRPNPEHPERLVDIRSSWPKLLTKYDYKETCTILITGNGEHHIYKQDPRITVNMTKNCFSINGIPVSLDIKMNGYIAIYPSLHKESGKYYKIKDKDPEVFLTLRETSPSLPEWFFSILGKDLDEEFNVIGDYYDKTKAKPLSKAKPLPLTTPSRLFEVLETGLPDDNEASMRKKLDLISSTTWNDRDEWLRIGFALFNKGFSFDLWDEYSQKSDHYIPDGEGRAYCEKRWGTSAIKGLGFPYINEICQRDNPLGWKKLFSTRSNTKSMILDYDEGLAKLFMKNCNDVKIVNKARDCYIWSDRTCLWEERPASSISQKVRHILRPIIKKYIKKEQDEELKKTLQKVYKYVSNKAGSTSIANCLDDLYEFEFRETLNIEPDLLPLKNGLVLDIKDLKLRPRTKEDRFSLEFPVSYTPWNTLTNDLSSLVLKFMKDIMVTDDMVNYMQAVLGYCLTGYTDQRCTFLWVGIGSNGKGVLSEIMTSIMGKLSAEINTDVFIESKRGTAGATTNHLIPLIGIRLGIASETKPGEKLNATLLKRITSDTDKVTMRANYDKEIQVKTQVKLIVGTNNPPDPNVEDQAMIDRLRIIEFPSRFTDNPKNGELQKDTKLMYRLKKEGLDTFFSWIVQGAHQYSSSHLLPAQPRPMIKATKALLAETDSIGQFLKYCVKLEGEISCKLLYESYQLWCEERGMQYKAIVVLGKELTKRKFKKFKNARGCMIYQGISIKGDNISITDI